MSILKRSTQCLPFFSLISFGINRINFSKSVERLIYFFFTGRRIIFLHGFQKKTQRTPRREIEIARRRMNDYLAQEGGET